MSFAGKNKMIFKDFIISILSFWLYPWVLLAQLLQFISKINDLNKLL